MDGKSVLFGRGWDDFIKPVNEHFENLKNAVQTQGAHAELARWNAQNGDEPSGSAATYSGTGAGDFFRAPDIAPLGGPGPQNATQIPANALSPPDPQGQSQAAPGYSSREAGGDNAAESIATGLYGAGLAADSAAAFAAKVARGAGGSKAALEGVEGATRSITAPLAVGEAIAGTAQDIKDGASSADAVGGNMLRSGAIFGASLAGPPGIAAGYLLHRYLPKGAVIGHTLLSQPLPNDGLINAYPLNPD